MLAKKTRERSIQFWMLGTERMGTLEERFRNYGEELCRIFRAVGIQHGWNSSFIGGP